jgi:hypothetical protein
MLFVKTMLGPSPIHGIGLFADQCIPQGIRIWECTPGFDVKLSAAFVDNAPEPLKSWLATHTYLSRTSVSFRQTCLTLRMRWCPSIACMKGLQRDAGHLLSESVDECQIALRS